MRRCIIAVAGLGLALTASNTAQAQVMQSVESIVGSGN